MEQDEYPETFKTILKEMCKKAKAPYTKINFDSPEWYLGYCWSEKKEDEFIEWMIDYLYTNSQARREILNFPTKSKKQIDRAVRDFVFNYGWSICEKKK